MAIDTQSLASIGDNLSFDAAGAQGKALSIKDMMDREQLNKLQLTQQKQDAATDAKVQAYLKTADYSTPEGRMRATQGLNQISPKHAMAFDTYAQKHESGQVQNMVDQIELMDHQQGLVVSAIDPIVSEARAMKSKGADDMTVNAFIAQQVPGALQRLNDTKLPNGQSALHPEVLKAVNNGGPITLAKLEGFEAQTKQGQAAIRQRLEQVKADTGVRKENESERHNQRMEELGARRTSDSEQREKDKSGMFDGKAGELLGALAERGVSLPTGLRSKEQMSRTLNSLIERNPDISVDQIADKVRSGQIDLGAVKKETQVAAGQVGKLELATQELDTFGDQVLNASAQVPRGNFVPFSRLRQTADSSISDPNLLNLKVKLQALNNAYDQLAARGGTDTEKRAHIHQLFDSANSDAAVRRLVQAVKEEAKGAQEAARRTMRSPGGDADPPTATRGNVVHWDELK